MCCSLLKKIFFCMSRRFETPNLSRVQSGTSQTISTPICYISLFNHSFFFLSFRTFLYMVCLYVIHTHVFAPSSFLHIRNNKYRSDLLVYHFIYYSAAYSYQIRLLNTFNGRINPSIYVFQP